MPFARIQIVARKTWNDIKKKKCLSPSYLLYGEFLELDEAK